ncbi:hypothetical protein [Streptomyces scopuliridis]|uniref:hypothetical protein n=1 Tax=Streptomyces scopuliridis TaxID=452529 RepID=UPI002DD7B269|nr:hypothetical protein [Streptomyces scopuliridis]
MADTFSRPVSRMMRFTVSSWVLLASTSLDAAGQQVPFVMPVAQVLVGDMRQVWRIGLRRVSN